MKKFNNKSGFTLIEIIVVLIIVGILAAIALPSLFSNVSKSKGAEAIASLGPYKATLEGCLARNVDTESACTSGTSGLPLTTTNFTYALSTAPADESPNYVLTATNMGATGTVTLTRSSVNGTLTCGGTGVFAGVC